MNEELRKTQEILINHGYHLADIIQNTESAGVKDREWEYLQIWYGPKGHIILQSWKDVKVAPFVYVDWAVGLSIENLEAVI